MSGQVKERLGTGRSRKELFASGVLEYHETDVAYALISTPKKLKYYTDIVVEFKVTTSDDTTNETLTFGIATSNYELSGSNAIDQLTSGYWTSKAITLTDESGDVLNYMIRIPANELNGKFVYAKYAYSADPIDSPTIEAKLNLV